MAPIIDAQNLYKCYPGFPPVLRGVNIQVLPGEMVAIMGPSGCGKSTMLHVLGMLHAPDSGSLQILNTDVLPLTNEETAAFRRGNMGFVMQSSNLFDHSTVFENVEFPLIYENVAPEERWERVIRALELVRLSHRVSYRSNRLSGGEQQRVAIARAMVNNPRILLADEPTGALDSRTSKVIMENFCTLAHEGGIAMVIVTHDPSVAAYCDTVYTLEEGVLQVQRKSPIPAPSGKIKILESKPRIMNAVCVVDNFPSPYGSAAVQHVLNMYDAQLLSRIYSMQRAKLAALAGDEHLLPVPTKKQGFLRNIGNVFSLLRSSHGNPGTVWACWSRIPAGQRINIFKGCKHIWHFAKGINMVRWSIDDKTQHLHALDAHATATAAWLAAKVLNIPFSFNLHTRDLKNLIFVARKAQDASFVRCDTDESRNELAKACLAENATFNTSKLHVVYDSPDIWPNAEDLEQPPIGRHGEINILAAGHFTSQKSLGLILNACLQLKKSSIPFKLTLAGTCSNLLRLKAFILFKGLRKHVHTLGYVPHEHMPELYRKSHIFIAAGTQNGGKSHDGIPTSLMEAMAFGIPIVASDLPGHLEVLEHEKSAFIFPNGNEQALFKAIEKIILYPDESIHLGKKAQVIAHEYFSTEKQTSIMSAIMQQQNQKST